jgi:sugar O-acyltransferase (sialic acid O-acetyltransferase NeuD family)
MRKAILLGAGGHSRVVQSILCEIQSHSTVGIIDIGKTKLDAEIPGEVIMGLPVLSQNVLKKFMGCKELDVFLAIGDCSLRSYWWEKVLNMGFHLPNLLSPNAIVHPSVSLGSANVICSGVFIGPEVRIGSNNLINTGSILEHESFVGSHCHIAPRSIIAGRAHVADGCFVGAGSVIIDNIKVADFTTVGAGAVITADIIEPSGVYVGVPGRRADWVSK